ncbi:MAG: two-component system response regulator AlgR [Arenicella sp.]
MKINALVVDDEPLARNRLKRMLEDLNVEVLGEGADGNQAIELLERYAVDMLFIDINMPTKDGLAAADEIMQTVERPPSIVFCTAYDEYAIQAFKANASAYLLKPVTREDLAEVIQRAAQINRMQLNQLQAQTESGSTLAIGVDLTIENVDIKRIAYFRSVDKHVYASLAARGEVLVDFTLKELESNYALSFVRCHRNALLNRSYLAKLSRDEDGKSFVSLKNCEAVFQVSRRHLAEVKKCFR